MERRGVVMMDSSGQGGAMSDCDGKRAAARKRENKAATWNIKVFPIGKLRCDEILGGGSNGGLGRTEEATIVASWAKGRGKD